VAADYQAYLWGIKAAQAGLQINSNPYRGHRARAAWLSGLEEGERLSGTCWREDGFGATISAAAAFVDRQPSPRKA